MTSTTDSKTDRIRELNDGFRRTFVGGAAMITAGVEAMPLDQRPSLLQKIRSFDALSEDNDPHHEHDFGSIDEAGVRCFFKIDYYDRKTEFGSPDAADPAVTAGLRLDEALRGFLAEHGTKRLAKEDLWRLVGGALRPRLIAHSLAGLHHPGDDPYQARPALDSPAHALFHAFRRNRAVAV